MGTATYVFGKAIEHEAETLMDCGLGQQYVAMRCKMVDKSFMGISSQNRQEGGETM